MRPVTRQPRNSFVAPVPAAPPCLPPLYVRPVPTSINGGQPFYVLEVVAFVGDRPKYIEGYHPTLDNAFVACDAYSRRYCIPVVESVEDFN